MISTRERTAVYVYGVVGSDDRMSPDLETVESGGLVAIVREVPLDEFGEETLPEHLNDPEWLERNARAHEDTLAAAAESATVVPFRFGVICNDRSDVARLLEEHAAELRRDLERVRGREELGVKVWCAASRAAEPPTEPSGGRAYLERRLDDRRRAEELAAEKEALVRSAHERLARAAVAAVVNRPQPKELSGRDEQMVLNAAYLVRRGDATLVREVAALNAEHASAGYAFELTGPWPPYNFVGEDA
jgi:hypothetical protein